jgi:NADH-quinone oxidoreductase subunit M
VQALVARSTYRFLVAIVAAFLALLFAGIALADPPLAALHGGRIVLTAAGKARGPVVLSSSPGGYVGEFTVANAGAEPLTVTRLAIRGDEEDVRSPSRLSARFADGPPGNATLPPGASKTVVIAWTPERDARVRQALGHVVVTSSDEQAGEAAMGFRAQLPTTLGFLGEHALTLLVMAPMVVILLVGAAWLTGRGDVPGVRYASLAVAAGNLALAVWVHHFFSSDVGRADGNEGYQFVERAVWVRSLGAEWYVGVDGTSLPFVLLAAVTGFVAVLLANAERRGAAYHAGLALLSMGVFGALVALDLAVLFAAWQLVWFGLLLLVGRWGGTRRPRAAAKVAIAALVANTAMLVAFVALSRASGPSFLADGDWAPHTMAIPELGRASFAAQPAILGLPFVGVVWLLILLAVAIVTPVVPFHLWLPDVLEQAPPSAGVLIAGAMVSLGPCMLVRLGLDALPEGVQWLGASLATLGALGAAWGGLCAMVQRDLRRFVGYTTIASAGMCLYGIGASTPEGIAGGLFGTFAHGLSVVLVLGFATALEERLHTCDATRVHGLMGEVPALAGLGALGLGVSLGVPGLAGFWSVLLTLLGGFVRYPGLSLIVAGALVASAAAHLRIARMLLLGDLYPVWRRSAYLESFGGHMPDATATELLALVPAAALAVLLGIWPSPLLASISASARDVSSVVDPGGPGR